MVITTVHCGTFSSRPKETLCPVAAPPLSSEPPLIFVLVDFLILDISFGQAHKMCGILDFKVRGVRDRCEGGRLSVSFTEEEPGCSPLGPRSWVVWGPRTLAPVAAGSVGTSASCLRLRKLASQPGLLCVPFRYRCNKANYGRGTTSINSCMLYIEKHPLVLEKLFQRKILMLTVECGEI